MRPLIALLPHVLGGLSLALLCAPIGHELTRDATFGATPAEPVATAPEDRAIPASRLTPTLGDPPSTLLLGAGCAGPCGMLLASLGEAWGGSGDAQVELVSAASVDELPPTNGAGVAIAFAQAAVQAATAPAATSDVGRWHAAPAIPARPGGLWLKPVITALLEPATPEPTAATADPPLQPAASEPQDEGATPAAVPPDAHAAPPLFDPSSLPAANPGTPSKPGSLPSEKPGVRSESPLPDGPAPNLTGPGPGPGPAETEGSKDPGPPVTPASEAPKFSPAAPDNTQNTQPWTPPVPAAPGSPLALLEPVGPVLERIAGGGPGPGEQPLLAPRHEAGLPELLVAVAVPEPGSLALLAIAGFCLVGVGRQRRH